MTAVMEPTDGSRLRILKAAAEIAAECGYEATTISKVTKRSGLPVSSVYWFFRDKDHLMAEVVRHSFDEWIVRQPVWEVPDKRGPLGERLRGILGRSVRTLAEAPDFLRIGHMLVLQAREVEPEGRQRFIEVRAQVETSIAEWFRGQLDKRLLRRRPELPVDLARLVIAATDGYFLAHEIGEAGDADEFVDMIVSVVDAAVVRAGAKRR